MPSELDYLIGAIMGEAGNQDAHGMAMVADALTNRVQSSNPSSYGTPGAGGTPNSYQGQLFARSGGVPQFSSAWEDQAARESARGEAHAYRMLFDSIHQPSRLSGANKAAYDRARAVAETFVNPEHPDYGQYRGIARGADFFDTGYGWAGTQPWGKENVFKHGGHYFRGQNPLGPEWTPSSPAANFDPASFYMNPFPETQIGDRGAFGGVGMQEQFPYSPLSGTDFGSGMPDLGDPFYQGSTAGGPGFGGMFGPDAAGLPRDLAPFEFGGRNVSDGVDPGSVRQPLAPVEPFVWPEGLLDPDLGFHGQNTRGSPDRGGVAMFNTVPGVVPSGRGQGPGDFPSVDDVLANPLFTDYFSQPGNKRRFRQEGILPPGFEQAGFFGPAGAQTFDQGRYGDIGQADIGRMGDVGSGVQPSIDRMGDVGNFNYNVDDVLADPRFTDYFQQPGAKRRFRQEGVLPPGFDQTGSFGPGGVQAFDTARFGHVGQDDVGRFADVGSGGQPDIDRFGDVGGYSVDDVLSDPRFTDYFQQPGNKRRFRQEGILPPGWGDFGSGNFGEAPNSAVTMLPWDDDVAPEDFGRGSSPTDYGMGDPTLDRAMFDDRSLSGGDYAQILEDPRFTDYFQQPGNKRRLRQDGILPPGFEQAGSFGLGGVQAFDPDRFGDVGQSNTNAFADVGSGSQPSIDRMGDVGGGYNVDEVLNDARFTDYFQQAGNKRRLRQEGILPPGWGDFSSTPIGGMETAGGFGGESFTTGGGFGGEFGSVSRDQSGVFTNPEPFGGEGTPSWDYNPPSQPDLGPFDFGVNSSAGGSGGSSFQEQWPVASSGSGSGDWDTGGDSWSGGATAGFGAPAPQPVTNEPWGDGGHVDNVRGGATMGDGGGRWATGHESAAAHNTFNALAAERERTLAAARAENDRWMAQQATETAARNAAVAQQQQQQFNSNIARAGPIYTPTPSMISFFSLM